MLTLIFAILMISVFGKMIGLAFRATWSIARVLTNIIFLPLFLIGLAFSGLIHVALFFLLIVGMVSLVSTAV